MRNGDEIQTSCNRAFVEAAASPGIHQAASALCAFDIAGGQRSRDMVSASVFAMKNTRQALDIQRAFEQAGGDEQRLFAASIIAAMLPTPERLAYAHAALKYAGSDMDRLQVAFQIAGSIPHAHADVYWDVAQALRSTEHAAAFNRIADLSCVRGMLRNPALHALIAMAGDDSNLLYRAHIAAAKNYDFPGRQQSAMLAIHYAGDNLHRRFGAQLAAAKIPHIPKQHEYAREVVRLLHIIPITDVDARFEAYLATANIPGHRYKDGAIRELLIIAAKHPEYRDKLPSWSRYYPRPTARDLDRAS